MVTTVSPSLYQNKLQRRAGLKQAAAGLARAERLPFWVLLFLLVGLPLLLNPTLFADLDHIFWWAKAWKPVWLLVMGLLYAGFYLPRVPVEVVSASVEAMEQTEPDAEPVAVQEPVEAMSLPGFQVSEGAEQETRMQARRAGRGQGRWRRRSRLRDADFPFLWFIPLFSSSQDSSS